MKSLATRLLCRALNSSHQPCSYSEAALTGSGRLTAALCALWQQAHGIKQSVKDIRAGSIIDYNGKLCQVLKAQHTAGMARRAGYVKVDMRDLQSNVKTGAQFAPADVLEVVELDERPHQFMYNEGDTLYLMDLESYEQVAVGADLFGEQAVFATVEDIEVQLCFARGELVVGKVPQTVVVKVVETDPSIKGESATASTKPAKLANGVVLQVPAYVVAGDAIVVNTEDSSFVRRNKEK